MANPSANTTRSMADELGLPAEQFIDLMQAGRIRAERTGALTILADPCYTEGCHGDGDYTQAAYYCDDCVSKQLELSRAEMAAFDEYHAWADKAPDRQDDLLRTLLSSRV